MKSRTTFPGLASPQNRTMTVNVYSMSMIDDHFEKYWYRQKVCKKMANTGIYLDVDAVFFQHSKGDDNLAPPCIGSYHERVSLVLSGCLPHAHRL